MSRNDKQFNRADLIKERYSSFVVDLRSQVNANSRTEASSKTETVSRARTATRVKTGPSFKFKFPAIKKRGLLEASSLLPKYTKNKKNWSQFFSGRHNSIIPKKAENINFSFFKKFRLKSKNKGILAALSYPGSSSKNYWQEVVASKRKILNRSFNAKHRRLESAERKIVWYRSLISFMLALLFLVVPLKILSYFEFLDVSALEDKVMNKSKAAVGQLFSAVDSVSALDFQEADAAFSDASRGFLEAKDDLSFINDSLLRLASWSGDPKIKLAAESKKFLEAGALSASLGRNLVLAMDSLFNHQEGEQFMQSLNEFTHYGSLAVQDAGNLDKILATIKVDNLPNEYREQFLVMASQVRIVEGNLSGFVSSVDRAKELLGLSQDKRYLLIFQNNSELRASGGFLGSYALLDVRGGKIRNLEVPAGGSYDTEGGMSVKVKAPEPLWLVNPRWHFWDANWWPHWPTTAQNLMWFYDKSGGPTVDGVISLTPTVVERLLEITGPIDMTDEYGVIISSENFWETTQKIVEHDNLLQSNPDDTADFVDYRQPLESSIPLEQDLENNPENKPKKIIGDLMARILEVLPQHLNKDNLVRIVSLFERNLSEKQILFYFTDENLQKEVSRRNWAGEIKNPAHDYLAVINTNIAGQKTDRKMQEKIEHISRVSPDGGIINTVKILRGHSGIKNEALTGVRNVNWVRVYVPGGSRLISGSGLTPPDEEYFEYPESDWLDSQFLEDENLAQTDSASGFKIYNENGKTVFAGWVMTDPGQTAEVTLVYELPFSFFTSTERSGLTARLNKLLNPNFRELSPYSLLVQKQPGAAPSAFSSRLELASSIETNLVSAWSHPTDLRWNRGWSITRDLAADMYFSVLLTE